MLSSLEPRYERILKLIAEGLTTNEIAQLTGLSPQSVDTYVKELKRELASEPEAQGHLPNRAILAAIYRRINQTQTSASAKLDTSSTL